MTQAEVTALFRGRGSEFCIHCVPTTVSPEMRDWSEWPLDGAAIDSCTVITTEPNALMRPLHNRMPAILRCDCFDRWLDPDIQDAELLQPLLVPYAADDLIAQAVSTYVNAPAHDTARCIEPLRS